MSRDDLSLVRIRRALAGAREMPTTELWRQQMRQQRRAAGIPQHELARMLGAKQATVSQIESGQVLASRYVPAIAVALNMPPPQAEVRDDKSARWIQAGDALRAKSEARFDRWLAFLESEADAVE
jgi:DNA-binding XRE family transcriptional regulator